MQADEYQSLKDSIENIGVQNPITLFEGMVIDGWHRYQAATELDMHCPSKMLGDVDPIDFVKSQNDARRHITASQKALAIASIYKWKPHGDQRSAPGADRAKSTAQMADMAGVGARTMEQAKAVEAKATPEVKAAVKAGTMSVKKAAETTKPKKDKPDKPAKPEPKPEVLDDFHISETDLLAEMQETQDENKQLLERVEIMSKDDKAAEIGKLLTRIAGLEGRIKQLMMQVKTSADGEKYHAAVIHKLRKILGVEGHKKIISEVMALVSDRRLAA